MFLQPGLKDCCATNVGVISRPVLRKHPEISDALNLLKARSDISDAGALRNQAVTIGLSGWLVLSDSLQLWQILAPEISEDLITAEVQISILLWSLYVTMVIQSFCQKTLVLIFS